MSKCCCLGSLAVSELETTVRRLVALETSAATVEGATLEDTEETVALVEVKELYLPCLVNFESIITLK